MPVESTLAAPAKGGDGLPDPGRTEKAVEACLWCGVVSWETGAEAISLARASLTSGGSK